MKSIKSLILISTIAIGILIFSFGASGANQNVSQENITSNLSILEAPELTNVLLEDNDTLPINILDPSPNTTFEVNCSADVTIQTTDLNLDDAWGYIYHNSTTVDAADDPQNHYTNSTCLFGGQDGDNSATVVCTFKPIFYAWNGTWVCNITVNETDAGLNGTGRAESYMTELLAINVDDSDIDFGQLTVGEDTGTDDKPRTIWNEGNINIGVKLNTWRAALGDGDSMGCTTGSIDAEQLRVSDTGSTDWDTKIQIPSTDNDGTDVLPTFSIARQTSGVSPNSGTLYFGMGTRQAGILGDFGGVCSGNLMFTGIAD